MSPIAVDTENSSRKRKLSNSVSSEHSFEKRSRLSDASWTARGSIERAFSWVANKSRRVFSRETISSPFAYVHRVWDELSQSIGQSYEQYQGPVLEGPELISTVPTMMPMSTLTANAALHPSTLTTSTTFMNLAPQPSLPPLGGVSALHSGGGNALAHHPLQSLHAMQAGEASGPEINGHAEANAAAVAANAAAAAAIAAAQHQQILQISLARSSAGPEQGKYPPPMSRGGGFVPAGFSTPIVAVSTSSQARIGRPVPLHSSANAADVSHRSSSYFQSRCLFSANQNGTVNGGTAPNIFAMQAKNRKPIRLKRAYGDSTHDKLFHGKSPHIVRKSNTKFGLFGNGLRSPSPTTSHSVSNVIRNLFKAVRRKPYAVTQSVNLREKLEYQELLKGYGIKCNHSVSQGSSSSVSSQEARSRSSSIASPSPSHTPPLSSLPTDVKWNPLTPTGTKLKPIRLDDEDDDLVYDDDKPVDPDKTHDAATEDDVIELTSSQKTSTNSDINGDIGVLKDSSDGESRSLPRIEALNGQHISAPKLNSALILEKEDRPPKLVDLTGDEERLEIRPTTMEKKVTARRVNIPSEPSFMRSARESPYADKTWLENFKHSAEVDKNKNDETIMEQKANLEFYRKEHEEEEKELYEYFSTKLKIAQRIKPPVEEIFIESSEEESEDEVEEDKEFPPLTAEMEERINEATIPHPAMEVLSTAFKLDITRKDIRTLVGMEWLNDEIINFYMNMLVDRSEKSEGELPKVYTFNTFFYPTLVKDGYARLKRWTRRVDLFSHDLILVPVHLQMHWCLAVIDLQNQEVNYYDSMGGNNQKCLSALKTYLLEEHRDKKKSEFDMNGWRFQCVRDIPQQMNGSDCGMFACKFAEYLTRRAPITFSQEHMPYFRRRMIFEILTLKLM